VFEVAENGAVIELPGGTRIEFAATTRASFRRDRAGPIVKLESGRGDFQVSAKQPEIHIETTYGLVTAAGARFSLDVVTGRPGPSSQPASGPFPSLTVNVAEGSVTIERGASLTKISAGQQRVFYSPT
jgi:ferric-dicitrate binding protein FerR (iron transport regulator)